MIALQNMSGMCHCQQNSSLYVFHFLHSSSLSYYDFMYFEIVS